MFAGSLSTTVTATAASGFAGGVVQGLLTSSSNKQNQNNGKKVTLETNFITEIRITTTKPDNTKTEIKVPTKTNGESTPSTTNGSQKNSTNSKNQNSNSQAERKHNIPQFVPYGE